MLCMHIDDARSRAVQRLMCGTLRRRASADALPMLYVNQLAPAELT